MEAKDSKTFRYFSKVAGSKFIFPDGHEVLFKYGFFDLKEMDYQDPFFSNDKNHPDNGKPRFEIYKRELDTLIKAGNPLLYIQGTQPEPLPKPKDSLGRVGADNNALSEVELARMDANTRNITGRVTGEQNKGGTNMDPNASTVDPGLQAVVLAERQDKLAHIRAEAEARAAAAKNAAANAQGGSASNS